MLAASGDSPASSRWVGCTTFEPYAFVVEIAVAESAKGASYI